MWYIVCPNCRGKGFIQRYNKKLAFMTFGVSLIFDYFNKITCPVCKGTGLEQKENRYDSIYD